MLVSITKKGELAMKKIILCLTVIFGAVALTACGIGNTNTTYERAEIGAQGRVEYGKIVDILPVAVAGTSEVGTLGGAVAGGAAGSMIGGNTAVNVVGAVGGAVLGGVVGGATEKAITKDNAYEFLVKKSTGAVVSVVQSNELHLRIGDNVYLTTVQGTTRIRGRAPTVD